MKNRILVLAVIVLTALTTYAQKLPIILLPETATLHFLSPEPIQYVDISTKSIAGDLPLKNILRIKRIPDSLKKGFAASNTTDAIITIAGEKFIAQYKVIYSPDQPDHEFPTQFEILPEHTRPLDIRGISLSQNQLKNYATQLLFKKRDNGIANAKAYGIRGNINHLTTLGDYIFIDLAYTNNSSLKYDTDEIRFKVEDEKINKASTVQSIELKPEFILFSNHGFRKNYRNIYVFKKFTFPGHKVLKIELNEKQLSGRIITLKLKYKELLEADTF
jgi:conjugative transposon TraN protein